MANREKNENTVVLSVFIKAAFFMLALVLVLAVLTSAKTGISFFRPEIMSVLSTIFVLSLVLLGCLALGLFIAALAMGKNAPVRSGSTLIKDNTLRYDVRDERGRKRKKTIDIRKIDDFLSRYTELYMIRDTRMHKQDVKAKSNANNLVVSLPDGREISLRQLHGEDPEFYDQICAYLDKIKDKGAIDLSFGMRRYAAEEDLALQGDEILVKMADLRKKVSDKEVRELIRETEAKIADSRDKIEGNGDKLRRLYDHYLGMLNEIIGNFITLESHDASIVDISKAKEQLTETLHLIGSAFDSLGMKEEGFEQLDAQVQGADQYMNQVQRKEGN